MSDTEFSKFRAAVLANTDLQNRLLKADDRAEFVSTVVETATKLKFEVCVEDVEKALNAGRRAWIERWI